MSQRGCLQSPYLMLLLTPVHVLHINGVINFYIAQIMNLLYIFVISMKPGTFLFSLITLTITPRIHEFIEWVDKWIRKRAGCLQAKIKGMYFFLPQTQFRITFLFYQNQYSENKAKFWHDCETIFKGYPQKKHNF